MARDVFAPLQDILNSGEIIAKAVRGQTLERYREDVFIRSVVERHFITIGEALNRLRRIDSARFETIPDAAAIVAFRNILVHGYDAIDDEIVWIAATTRLEPLLRTVRQWMLQAKSEGSEAHNTERFP